MKRVTKQELEEGGDGDTGEGGAGGERECVVQNNAVCSAA